MAASRATNHNGRTGDNGKTIKPLHNDRNFDVSQADNIDGERSGDNVYWTFTTAKVKGADGTERDPQTFDEQERAVYEEYFRECLDSRNEKAIKGRHKERVQDMEQFRLNKKACPEETIFSIGNADNPCNPETLKAIFEEYVAWYQKQFPNVMLLNAAMHLDEASPHIQHRQVWTAHEGDMLVINQEKALAEMGIERPNPELPVSRRNNAKMTFTKMCREKQIEIARSHGIEIEDTPREPSKSGLSMLEYKKRKIEEDIDRYEQALTEATADVKETKTVKVGVGVFSKEKEVPKTADELKRDKAIVGAKLVQQREKSVQKREENIETTVNNAVALERQEGAERQRKAVARAREEEQAKAEQERKQLQRDRDRAVKELAEEQSRSKRYKELATDYAYFVDELPLTDSQATYAAQLWEDLQGQETPKKQKTTLSRE